VTWLRRNLIALIVIVVTIPVFAFVLVGVPLLDRSSGTPIVTVKQGDTIETGGYSFTLTASQEFVGTGTGTGTNNIPLGTSVVGAILDVKPTTNPIDGSCDAELTSRAGGAERAWSTVSSPGDFDYGVGDDRDTVCLLDSEADEAFQLESVFLTPAGAYDSATLDVTVGSESFRFELVHE
jgi:hypothetical protein